MSTPYSPHTLPAIAHLPETKRLVIAQAVDGLFAKPYFSVCTVDNILKALDRHQDTEAYRLLATLHCVNYAQMRPEVRDRLPALVAEALAPPTPNHVSDAVVARVFDGANA